jgi:hypothetical protein
MDAIVPFIMANFASIVLSATIMTIAKIAKRQFNRRILIVWFASSHLALEKGRRA